MPSKRTVIETFRKMLQEVGADSNYTNQFLYNTLLPVAMGLIKREISAGRIYKNTKFFQTLKCQEVIEVSTIGDCCPIRTDCVIYRTKCKVPDAWQDVLGPIIKTITSVDGTTGFFYTTPTTWQNKRQDPYQRMSSEKYAFFADGYLWFPEHNPHLINIFGFFMDDISQFNTCSSSEECVRYLDTQFPIPDWVLAETYGKAVQLLAPSKQSPEDEQPDKNPNKKD